jgi:hypothetical protein
MEYQNSDKDPGGETEKSPLRRWISDENKIDADIGALSIASFLREKNIQYSFRVDKDKHTVYVIIALSSTVELIIDPVQSLHRVKNLSQP